MSDIIIISLFIILGFSMVFYWIILYFIIEKKKNFHYTDLKTEEEYIIFHILIELLTGFLLIVSGFLLFTENDLGRTLGLFSSGMLFYAAFNAISWSSKNQKTLTLVLAPSALIGIINLMLLA